MPCRKSNIPDNGSFTRTLPGAARYGASARASWRPCRTRSTSARRKALSTASHPERYGGLRCRPGSRARAGLSDSARPPGRLPEAPTEKWAPTTEAPEQIADNPRAAIVFDHYDEVSIVGRDDVEAAYWPIIDNIDYPGGIVCVTASPVARPSADAAG